MDTKIIKGMLLVLNKIIPKINIKYANFFISEINDLKKLNGYFYISKKFYIVKFRKK